METQFDWINININFVILISDENKVLQRTIKQNII